MDNPFTVPPLSVGLDFGAGSVKAETVLHSEYDTAALDAVTAKFVQHLRRPQSLALLQPKMTEAAFREKLHIWLKATTTSLSGLHLGHWKALVAKNYLSGSTLAEAAALDSAQQDLVDLHLGMIKYALRWGYSYKRWREVVNGMLQKGPGHPMIHRLRVIHIYKADYNLILGVMWRKLLHKAEDMGSLNYGQFGSRPRQTVYDPVFVEEMMSETSRASRQSQIKFDNGTTACYERIVLSVATLASCRFDMPREVVRVMKQTLEPTKYRVNIGLGISNSTSLHTDAWPIYGMGSANSPTVWGLINSLAFDVHQSLGHGAQMASSTGRVTDRICMIGFLNDSTGTVANFSHPTSLASMNWSQDGVGCNRLAPGPLYERGIASTSQMLVSPSPMGILSWRSPGVEPTGCQTIPLCLTPWKG